MIFECLKYNLLGDLLHVWVCFYNKASFASKFDFRLITATYLLQTSIKDTLPTDSINYIKFAILKIMCIFHGYVERQSPYMA